MLAAGQSNQVIAEQFFVTLDTVKKHVSHLPRQARRGQPHRGRRPGQGARPHLLTLQLDHTSVKYGPVTLAEESARISCHIFRSTHDWVSFYP